jgi:peroxiredoxin
MTAPLIHTNVLANMVTNKGENLRDISFQEPIFLVFLRHFGCVFCKEALSDLSDMLDSIRNNHIRLVMVHMSTNDIAERYFENFHLNDVSHISDPDMQFYKVFGLSKGKFSQLYGLSTWMRGMSAKNKPHKLELAKQLGDSTQMPGIFTLYQNEVIDSYIHRRASDLPDYEGLLKRAMGRVNE